MANETLIKFPCDFTIKVFGVASEEFEAAVLAIVHKHVPNLSGRTFEPRLSKQGKYCALSITVYVESKEQLDDLYRDLSSSPQILMTL